jgi:hypothetical protein
MKSPAHTARIPTLLKLFPNARFIHIARNPLAIYPSTVKVWRVLNSVQGLHNPAQDEPWMEEFVFSVFETLFKRYDEDKALIPDGHLVEIAFEDLAADPKRVMKDIYTQLDLGDFSRAEPGMDEYLGVQKDYKPNVFNLPDDLRMKILKRWSGYIKRFGYGEAVK